MESMAKDVLNGPKSCNGHIDCHGGNCCNDFLL